MNKVFFETINPRIAQFFRKPFFWIAAVLAILIFLPPVGEGREIKNNLQQAFKKSDIDRVLIKDITNFEWDKVCFIYDPDLNELSKEVGFDIKTSGFLNQIHRYWPFYQAGLLFLKDGQIIKNIGYYTNNVGSIVIGSDKFSYIRGRSHVGNYCNDRSRAAFKKEITPQNYKLILFVGEE